MKTLKEKVQSILSEEIFGHPSSHTEQRVDRLERLVFDLANAIDQLTETPVVAVAATAQPSYAVPSNFSPEQRFVINTEHENIAINAFKNYLTQSMEQWGAKYELQYSDYLENQWTAPVSLTPERIEQITTDFSIKDIRLSFKI